jgi:ankyrin repeat protein
MFMRAAERFSVPSDKLTEFLNLADSTGFSLIHYLTALGYQAIIKYLLKFNIDINTIGVDGLTPLQIAILLNKEVPLISIIQNMVSFLI